MPAAPPSLVQSSRLNRILTGCPGNRAGTAAGITIVA
jgi:hypothetical protein